MIFKLFNRLTALVNLQSQSLHQRLCSAARYADPRRLAHHESRVYSQNGEDGILQHMINALGLANGRFLEIGIEDGTENNTRALLSLGWSGTWIEGSAPHAARIRKNFRSQMDGEQLLVINSMVTPSNIEGILAGQGVSDVDVLSIDIDLHTHHIWRAITSLSPAIAIVEYNAMWKPPIRWETPYIPGTSWDGCSAEYGASLQTITDIGTAKGYLLVGCDLTGTNAFFVRGDLADERQFMPVYDAAFHYEPARPLLSPPGSPRWR